MPACLHACIAWLPFVAGCSPVYAHLTLHALTPRTPRSSSQAGVDKLASVVGVTLGPKGRNVVLESKYVSALQPPCLPEALLSAGG